MLGGPRAHGGCDAQGQQTPRDPCGNEENRAALPPHAPAPRSPHPSRIVVAVYVTVKVHAAAAGAHCFTAAGAHCPRQSSCSFRTAVDSEVNPLYSPLFRVDQLGT